MPLKDGKINEIQTIAFDADIEKFDILSLLDYINSVDRKEGVKKGVASRELHNKQLQQLSRIVVGLCQFIANRIAGNGVYDNDTIDNIENKLQESILSILSTTLTAKNVIVSSPLIGGGNLNADVNISIKNATTTQIGVTKMATDSDVITGTSESVAVTPKSLQQYAPQWNAITGKPATYTPSAHNHNTSDITGGILPISRGGTGNNQNVTRCVSNYNNAEPELYNCNSFEELLTKMGTKEMICLEYESGKTGFPANITHGFLTSQDRARSLAVMFPLRTVDGHKMFVRKTTDGTWSNDWITYYLNTYQIDQEVGSNYIRYGNGIQMCWGNANTDSSIDTGISKITYPKAFIRGPVIQLTPFNRVKGILLTVEEVTSTQCYVYSWSDTTSTKDTSNSGLHWIAIGSWK